MCFAAKWVGEPEVFFHSAWGDGYGKLVRMASELLDQADSVLHYNGQRFDEPVINTEIVKLDLRPPSPYKRIDLYQAVRGKFAFMSNSLDYVTRQLGTDGKVANEGFDLWLKVMGGDREAQQRMREYNIGDVHANESLYDRVLPWIPGHPNRAVFDGLDRCPACGSSELVKRGFAYTQVRVYQRYCCTICGKWSRGGKSLAGVDLREVAA